MRVCVCVRVCVHASLLYSLTGPPLLLHRLNPANPHIHREVNQPRDVIQDNDKRGTGKDNQVGDYDTVCLGEVG